jgi:hypothetical protein
MRKHNSCYNRVVVLDAPSTMAALGSAIAVVGLLVTLGKGLIAVVRVGKALAAELGLKKI